MRKYLLLIFTSLVCLNLQTYAQGGLLITPKRVVLEGNKQRARLNLVNMGKDTSIFSISFKQYNMNEKGRLEVIEKYDSTQMFADSFIRIFPRRVTLAPGEGQAVMLQYRRKADMKAGEYRSHLRFRDDKNYEALGKNDQPSLDSTQMSVSVTAIYGISIPVIIRVGEVNVGATLSDLHIGLQQDSKSYLNLTVNRTGNISLRGKLTVEYIPVKGKPSQIGAANVVIYTNLNQRNFSIKLKETPGISLKKGILKVRLTSLDDAKKKEVYAESEIQF
jgi:hypothetical protein